MSVSGTVGKSHSFGSHGFPPIELFPERILIRQEKSGRFLFCLPYLLFFFALVYFHSHLFLLVLPFFVRGRGAHFYVCFSAGLKTLAYSVSE